MRSNGFSGYLLGENACLVGFTRCASAVGIATFHFPNRIASLQNGTDFRELLEQGIAANLQSANRNILHLATPVDFEPTGKWRGHPLASQSIL